MDSLTVGGALYVLGMVDAWVVLAYYAEANKRPMGYLTEVALVVLWPLVAFLALVAFVWPGGKRG